MADICVEVLRHTEGRTTPHFFLRFAALALGKNSQIFEHTEAPDHLDHRD